MLNFVFLFDLFTYSYSSESQKSKKSTNFKKIENTKLRPGYLGS